MKILFVGDVYGKLGRKSLEKYIPKLNEEHRFDFIIVNSENSAHGRGITKSIYKFIKDLGVDIITMGDHSFKNDQIFDLFNDNEDIIRPANYENAEGCGFKDYTVKGKIIRVVNLLGKTFMNNSVSCPFKKMDNIIKIGSFDYIIVDFHAEATSEKVAFGLDFDGKVNAVLGTHTHVPTADSRILEKGTHYISDVGMVGSSGGVIGVDKDVIIKRFRDGYSKRNKPSDVEKLQFNAVILDFDENTINRINIFE